MEKNLPLGHQGRGSDPDGDGRSNLAEFLFGGNPLSGSDPAAVITPARRGAQFVLTFLARGSSTGATYLVEESPALDPGGKGQMPRLVTLQTSLAYPPATSGLR